MQWIDPATAIDLESSDPKELWIYKYIVFNGKKKESYWGLCMTMHLNLGQKYWGISSTFF